MRNRPTFHPDHISPGVRFDEELKGVLIYVFITMRKYDIGKIASQLNMEYNDLYAYISGRRTMPITLLLRITETTGDRIFFDTIFAGSNIRWNFKQEPRKGDGNPVADLLSLVSSVGQICDTLNAAIRDKKIDGKEKTDILMRIQYAETGLNLLKESIGTSNDRKYSIDLDRR